MKVVTKIYYSLVVLLLVAMAKPTEVSAQAAGYVGEATCITCHTATNPEIVNNYMKSGHRYKLNPVEDGVLRPYPTGRVNKDGESPQEVTVPVGTSWSDFAYVIGGYGWKARFIRKNGRIYTDDDQAQQNLYATLANGAPLRAAYHLGEEKVYNFSCFQCHTTGGTAEGSWNGVTDDSLGTFKDPGVTCEGCHGPGAEHVAGAFQSPPVLPPNTGDFLKIERCIECHQRGGATNAIPVSGGYIRHHEQGNEVRASKHGDGVGAELTCVSCHNQHVPDRYPSVAEAGSNGLNATCETCHATATYEVQLNGAKKNVECTDCHMSKAAKSAIGFQLGNGWKGDIPSHIMAINTNPVTKDAMFTSDGKVALDSEGHAAVTLDFACLACHTNKDVQWASDHAASIHTTGIQTATEDLADLPESFELLQNYPNPFNPTTVIPFNLPETADVSIKIYSVDGRLVETILRQTMPAGSHQISLNSDGLANGTYLYRLKAGSFVSTKMMTLLK
jgi:Secretion system C-terminal sorting domain/Cytochrome c554 and c-prime